jgi:hypothetical protein
MRLTTKLMYLSCSLIFFIHTTYAQDYRIGGESAKAALTEFLGDIRGDYISPDMPVVNQVMVMNGLPQEDDVVRGNSTIHSGCRPHSCPEKAAVVYDENGKIQAVGLMHDVWAPNPESYTGTSYTKTQHVVMFVPFKNKSLDAEILLLEWAHRHLAPETGVPRASGGTYLGNDKSSEQEGTIFETITLQ